jgi:hypothetical protein
VLKKLWQGEYKEQNIFLSDGGIGKEEVPCTLSAVCSEVKRRRTVEKGFRMSSFSSWRMRREDVKVGGRSTWEEGRKEDTGK